MEDGLWEDTDKRSAFFKTEKWELIFEPCKLEAKDVLISRFGGGPLIGTYTLNSLDSSIQDPEFVKNIKEKWDQALAVNPRLKPGLKFRLEKYPDVEFWYSPPPSEEFGPPKKVKLSMGITDYGVFVATNSAAKQNPEYAQYLIEGGKRLFNNPYALFASPIGNCAIVESSDNKIALIKRSMGVHEYTGFYDTPGGHAEPLKHGFNSKDHFRAIKDEVSEEIKIPVESIEEAYFIGMCVNLENFRKPDMLFYLRTGLHSEKMDPNEEVSRLEKLTRDELFEKWKNRNYNIVPPSEALLVAYFNQQKGYDLSFVKRLWI